MKSKLVFLCTAGVFMMSACGGETEAELTLASHLSSAASTTFRRIKNRSSKKYMTLDGDLYVKQRRSRSSDKQQWEVKVKSGRYTFINRRSGNCLDVQGGSTADGARVIHWTCDGGASQKWRYAGAGVYAAVHSGLCLDVKSGSNSLVQRPCDGTKSQIWYFRDRITSGRGDGDSEGGGSEGGGGDGDSAGDGDSGDGADF